jgi:hypothetical protein
VPEAVPEAVREAVPEASSPLPPLPSLDLLGYVHRAGRSSTRPSARGGGAKEKLQLRDSLMPYFQERFGGGSGDAVVDTPSGTVRVRYTPDHRAVAPVTPARVERVRLALTPQRLRSARGVSILAALEEACCEALEEVCAERRPHLLVSVVDGSPHEVPRITVPLEVMGALSAYHEADASAPRPSPADRNLRAAQARDLARYEAGAIECLRSMPDSRAEVCGPHGALLSLVLKDSAAKGGSLSLAKAKPLVAETLSASLFDTPQMSLPVAHATDRDLEAAIFLAAGALERAVRAHGRGRITSRIKITPKRVGGRSARAREAKERKEAALDAALAPYLDATSAAEVPVEVWKSLHPQPCECGARASFGLPGDALLRKRWCGACSPPEAIKV